MIDKLSNHFELYKKMLIICLETFVDMLHAKFIFFAFVALAIGTIGIWVPVAFELDLNERELKPKQTYEATVIDVESLATGKPLAPSDTVVAGLLFEISESPASSGDIRFENFSIFMYVIGILGILAAEYFIKDKVEKTEEQGATLTFSMFIWFSALLLSFWALKEPKIATWQLWVSFWLSVSLWLSYTVKKADFNGDVSNSKDKLGGKANPKDAGFNGDGLQ